MSIYHCSMKAISRSSGRTASGSSAYRAGEKIRGINGEVHDYTKKKGVLYTEIVLPEGAPDWAKNREMLWNAVDSAEVRKNSTVAREYELALPSIISDEAREELARNFTKYIVKEYGVAADIAIHAPKEYNNNYHAHIMTSTRVLEPEGFGGKTRILDDRKTGREEVKKIREEWERQHNEAVLKLGGIVGRSSQVSCKTLKEQGITREPQIHLGVAAAAMERRGIQTERGDYNRDIEELRKLKIKMRMLEAQQAEKAEKQKKEAEVAAASPAMHQKPQETQELVRSVSPTVETMKPIRASEPTRDVPEAKKPIEPATPSMTMGEAEKILHAAASKIAKPLLEQEQKDWERAEKERDAKLQKAKDERESAVEGIFKLTPYYDHPNGGLRQKFLERDKKFRQRVHEHKQKVMEERHKHFDRRDKADEAIRDLSRPSYDRTAAKEKIHAQAMGIAAKENPEALAVIERHKEQQRIEREAKAARERELRAAETPEMKRFRERDEKIAALDHRLNNPPYWIGSGGYPKEYALADMAALKNLATAKQIESGKSKQEAENAVSKQHPILGKLEKQLGQLGVSRGMER